MIALLPTFAYSKRPIITIVASNTLKLSNKYYLGPKPNIFNTISIANRLVSIELPISQILLRVTGIS